MRLNIFFLIVFLLNVIHANGQDDYYSTDNVTTAGVKLIDGGDISNSAFCKIEKGEQVIKYSPNEVKEFGFGDGSVYVAKEIQISNYTQKVFLERLVRGKTVLYYYRGKRFRQFYLETDSAKLIPLPKTDVKENDFVEKLSDFTSDCEIVSYASKVVRYNKRSLTKFISKYNVCDSTPLPFLKYGVFFGITQSKQIAGKNDPYGIVDNATFKPDNSFYYGFFIDAPIMLSDFSAYTSIGFYQSAFSSNTRTYFSDTDVLINQSTLKIPLMIRYTIPATKFRPYINLGLNYSYNLRNSNLIYRATITDNIVQYETSEERKIISDNQLGYAFGLGIQYYLSYKKMAFAEIRFNKEFSVTSDSFINRTSIELTGGINF